MSENNELELKYGCNPNQKPAKVFTAEGNLPFTVLNGKPGYINLLDALNAWQLVSELKAMSGLPAAASFKHVSPAGAAIGIPLTDIEKQIYFIKGELSPQAAAYARARGADRMSSYGDFAALSDTCDAGTAQLLAGLVSDGIIAPDYEPEALKILTAKRRGGYCVLKADVNYQPPAVERREVYGVTFEQGRNNLTINDSLLENVVTKNKNIPASAKRDLLIALITLKYTQSNSVAYAKNGQVIGVGAGQQSRIHCTRLAGQKADNWFLRQAPQVLSLPFLPGTKAADRDNAIDLFIGDECADLLTDGVWQKVFETKPEPFLPEARRGWLNQNTGVSLASDAFFPFGDNIERARKSGAAFIAQPGGSVRDDNVIEVCDKFGIAMAFTGIRLFHH